MKSLRYYIAKVKSKITHSQAPIEQFYRNAGVQIGNNCLICSYILTKEPFLLSIGNNVTISTNVSFITHDNSAKLIFPDRGDLFGRISIGDNCFIGERAMLLYGVTLGNSVIVAAGAVVTKSFHEQHIIIGGNPAHIIGTWDDYKKKYDDNAIKRKEMMQRIQSVDEFLVRK